jgi:Trypsin-like peptidase domain
MTPLGLSALRLPFPRKKNKKAVQLLNFILNSVNILVMSTTRRNLVSSGLAQTPSTPATPQPPADAIPSPISFTYLPPASSTPREAIDIITPNTELPLLKKSELLLLRRKQVQLSSTTSQTLASLPDPSHLNALLSTLIFAQHEAGTAVCIHPSGWLLTCAHCFGDDEEEYQSSPKKRWLLYFTGLAVLVECRAWDPRRDLALLKIIAFESPTPVLPDTVPVFCYLKPSEVVPKYRLPLTCIGQPGRDDLEAEGNKKTKYNLIEISEGRMKGMVKGQDPQDNGEIGSLMHDCWTYWGHSGAPLVSADEGRLVGLHSSWDDKTAMRHGVPGIAIRNFLREHLPGMGILDESVGTSVNPIEIL